MTTLSSIATEVFDAVASEVEGVIKSIEFSRISKGEYDTATGTHAETLVQYAGRGLAETETARIITRDFPSYVVTGNETVWFVVDAEQTPKVGDSFVVGGRKCKIAATRDILETGELFRLLVV